MKKLVLLFCSCLLIVSCNNDKKTEKEGNSDVAIQEVSYASFGEKITDDGTLSNDEILEKYNNLKAGDTAFVKFEAKVNEVCQTKGCWMILEIGDDEAMVKFKDYGFFMPKNIAGKSVIVNGKAFVAEVGVDEQRHYAEDAGKPQDEIEAIIDAKRTLSFEADGVLIKM